MIACLLPWTTTMTACDPPEEGADDEGSFADDEDLGEIRPRCLVNGVWNKSAPLSLDKFTWQASMSGISPTNSYVSPCGIYYVIAATDVDNPETLVGDLYVEAIQADLITQAQCSTARFYYDIALKIDNQWVNFTEGYSPGQWNGFACDYGLTINWEEDPAAEIQHVQVAVRSQYTDASGVHYAKVGAKIGRR
ncbi:hypothetical protein [Nannocystis sp. SCPEA4]|uniref:hypothetical protein n=1 Tax=Nannocystis sp. SCPEA4 TaxID=2996787 RepID=UPI00226E6233|nr:hypothetical protein [Nannocystis sp. SCPEA4]MCY1060022.1 hypothetical protein [Nannocystis sp. SCPEA4]